MGMSAAAVPRTYARGIQLRVTADTPNSDSIIGSATLVADTVKAPRKPPRVIANSSNARSRSDTLLRYPGEEPSPGPLQVLGSHPRQDGFQRPHEGTRRLHLDGAESNGELE